MAFAISKTVLHLARRPNYLICPSHHRRPFALVQMPQQQQQQQQPIDLDKPSFTEQWSVYAFKVPKKLCNNTRKALKDHVLSMPLVTSFVRPNKCHASENELSHVMLLLLKYLADVPVRKHVAPPRGNTDQSFTGNNVHELVSTLRATNFTEKTPANVVNLIKAATHDDLVKKDIQITYHHWSINDILRNLLPPHITIPTSFETVGHIAHLNLREEHQQYKNLIATVMLDKLQPRITTIVNKLQSTGGPYRTFAMEVLAGDQNLETTHKENGCTFRMDFSKVYWNSRLESEHNRIVKAIKPGEILADAFCGIGPFAIPAARLKVCEKVYANDLNPMSVHYLKENAKLNHVTGEKFIASCACAREFLKRLIQKEKLPVTRVVMNFPAGAPEFLDVFRGLYTQVADRKLPMPLVHCYCFVKGTDDLDSARIRVRNALYGDEAIGAEVHSLPDSAIDVRDVRDVAPRKRQVCVTFQVPEDVAYTVVQQHKGPPAKKMKVAA